MFPATRGSTACRACRRVTSWRSSSRRSFASGSQSRTSRDT